uniref:Uncharacterized protein n=1 Tax=Strongyloides stercoralis TaxID=6248 RepID=A0A0K0E722_STRER
MEPEQSNHFINQLFSINDEEVNPFNHYETSVSIEEPAMVNRNNEILTYDISINNQTQNNSQNLYPIIPHVRGKYPRRHLNIISYHEMNRILGSIDNGRLEQFVQTNNFPYTDVDYVCKNMGITIYQTINTAGRVIVNQKIKCILEAILKYTRGQYNNSIKKKVDKKI